MAGYSNPFLPTTGNPLTPDQSQDASTVGWLNAASQLANMSAPHFAAQGPQATPLQLLTGGIQGYGQGVQGYANSLNQNAAASGAANSAMAKGTMDQLTTQRALNYFYPGGKSNGLPAALASTNITNPTAAPITSAVGASPTIPPVNASSLQPPAPPASSAPTTLSSFYGGTPNASTTPAGGTGQIVPNSAVSAQATALGVDVPTLARQLYQQGMTQMMLGQPGGSDLVSKAISIDPTVVQSTAAATAAGQLPADLTKIQATGAQARATAGVEAGLRPHEQSVMINGQLYTIPSNDAAASQGALPAGVSPGASTVVPAAAKSAADAQGKNLADAQDAQSLLDSRMQNALSMLKTMKQEAPNTFQGRTGKLAEGISEEGFGPWAQSNASQTKFEQLNNNLLTQELPGIIKGAGGRIDIPLLNSIKEASAIDPYAPHQTKLQAIDNLTDLITKAQQNAHRNTQGLGGAAGIALPGGASSGWSVTPVQ